VNAAREDVVSRVSEVTSGRGADVVFECAGLSTTYQQAIEMVHHGGKVELVGLYEQPVTWDPTSTITGDMTLIGCGLRWDLPGAVDLLQSGKVNTRPLLTHEFPLDKAKEAFETQLGAEDAVKVLVKP
jgi:alcohol dehydrogenase